MMQAYWPTAGSKPDATKHDIQHSTWYNSVEKVVLSHTMKGTHEKNTRIFSHNASEEIHKLKQKPGKNILMFGSPGAVNSLLKDQMVDELWLLINPIILGKGIPYLTGIKNKLPLKLISSKLFPGGVVCLQYLKENIH
jgi:dihydrofolate reductase